LGCEEVQRRRGTPISVYQELPEADATIVREEVWEKVIFIANNKKNHGSSPARVSPLEGPEVETHCLYLYPRQACDSRQLMASSGPYNAAVARKMKTYVL
jgi:hypothetical protein